MRIMPADKNPLRIIQGCSERISQDLLDALEHDYQPCIYVREWQHSMRDRNEFRLIVKDNELVGVSQYQYRESFDWVIRNARGLNSAICKFFDDHLREACHLDSYIADVWAVQARSSPIVIWQVRLLEINPFCNLTDPCLFNWDEEFDSTFRYMAKEEDGSLKLHKRALRSGGEIMEADVNGDKPKERQMVVEVEKDGQSDLVIDVDQCPVCGESHGNMAFKELSQLEFGVQRWAMCPTKGEPILAGHQGTPVSLDPQLRNAIDKAMGYQHKIIVIGHVGPDNMIRVESHKRPWKFGDCKGFLREVCRHVVDFHNREAPDDMPRLPPFHEHIE